MGLQCSAMRVQIKAWMSLKSCPQTNSANSDPKMPNISRWVISSLFKSHARFSNRNIIVVEAEGAKVLPLELTAKTLNDKQFKGCDALKRKINAVRHCCLGFGRRVMKKGPQDLRKVVSAEYTERVVT